MGYGNLTFEQALSDARFSHCSSREWCGAVVVHAYFREPTSPSGVLLAASAKLPDVQQLLSARGIHVTHGPTRGDIAAKQWSI